MRQRLFGRKSEQSADPLTPQMALFNEAESVAEPAAETIEEAVGRGKRKPLPADLSRIEIVHELPEHELTCTCGCRKHTIGEEISEQLEIVPIQIRVIKHVRKVYGRWGLWIAYDVSCRARGRRDQICVHRTYWSRDCDTGAAQ